MYLSLFKLGIVKEHELWSCVIYAPLRPAENVPLVSRRPQSVLRCDAYSVVVPFAAHFALSFFGAAAKGKQVDYVASSTHSVLWRELEPEEPSMTVHYTASSAELSSRRYFSPALLLLLLLLLLGATIYVIQNKDLRFPRTTIEVSSRTVTDFDPCEMGIILRALRAVL